MFVESKNCVQTELGHAASETSNYPSNHSDALLSGTIPRNKYHSTVYQLSTQQNQERTCGDPQPGAHGVQRTVKLVRGDVRQAMLLCPFLPHVARRLEGGLPVHTRAAA